MKFRTNLIVVFLAALFIFSSLCPAGVWYKTYPVTAPLDCNGKTGQITFGYDPNHFYVAHKTLHIMDGNYPSIGDYVRLDDANYPTIPISLADMNDSSIGTNELIDGEVSLADMNSSSVDSSKIVDGTIASADMSSAVIKVESVTVAGPNILTLFSSPKVLIAAPGAHNVIEFLGATIFYDYAGAAYGDAAQNMTVKYKAAGDGAAVSGNLSGTGFLTATADTAAKLLPAAVAATAAADIENQPLVLYMATKDPNDGVGDAAAGVLRVKISYRILPSGF